MGGKLFREKAGTITLRKEKKYSLYCISLYPYQYLMKTSMAYNVQKLHSSESFQVNRLNELLSNHTTNRQVNHGRAELNSLSSLDRMSRIKMILICTVPSRQD